MCKKEFRYKYPVIFSNRVNLEKKSNIYHMFFYYFFLLKNKIYL